MHFSCQTHVQAKLGLEWGEATNSTPLDSNKGGKEAACPREEPVPAKAWDVGTVVTNKDAVPGQDILIGQGIIGWQGITLVKVICD